VRAKHGSGIIAGLMLLLLLIVLPVSAADPYDQYYGDGINYSSQGRYADALAAYDRAVFISPNNADAWNNRGIALENLGRYSEAVSSYDKVISLQPGYADAWFNRGVAFRKMGQYPDAVASYNKALSINPSYAEAWLNRGVALEYLGRYDESIASYDKALALQPNFTAARENRELVLGKKERFNPITVGAIVFFVIIVAGLVYWYVKFRQGTGKVTDRIILEEKKPEEKKLGYGKIPEPSELHTLASLCAVINMHGRPILDEPEKVAALLEEMSQGDYQKERNALVLALKDRVPQELVKPHWGFTWVSTSANLKKQLQEKHGMSDDLAGWVIETWAKALEMET
jgi:hypothetical protein